MTIKMTPSLEAVLLGAIEAIKGYESDTFSWANEHHDLVRIILKRGN